MARYQILIADPLLQMGPQWPEGCSLAGQAEAGPAGTHWHLFDDPDAPEGLEGKKVELTMRRDDDGKPVIAERHAIVTHLVPPGGDGVLRCCGMTPFEVPRSDRMTDDPDLVTCGKQA